MSASGCSVASTNWSDRDLESSAIVICDTARDLFVRLAEDCGWCYVRNAVDLFDLDVVVGVSCGKFRAGMQCVLSL